MTTDNKVVVGLTHADDDSESVLISYLVGVEALRAGWTGVDGGAATVDGISLPKVE